MASTPITSASGATLRAEWSLLLAALAIPSNQENLDRAGALLREPLLWAFVLEAAERHGVVPLLYQALSRIGDDVPSDKMRWLKERHQVNLHKSLILARELIRILDRLDSLGIAVLPYKGLTLAEAMYGDMALRPAGDIDLLVRPQDFRRIKEAVADLGYTPHVQLSELEERAYLVTGYECAFDSAAGRNLLELQWAIQPRFYAVDVEMESLFQRAVTVVVAGRPMKTLSPEDQVLILSVHAAKHVWGRLIWLCDIAQILQRPDLNWGWVQQQANTLGIARILRVTLLLVSRLLGAPIPGALDTRLPGDRVALVVADHVRTQIVDGTSCDVESLAYFRLMMGLRERPRDRIRFVQRLVFTPGPNEWKAVQLPAPLFPLYRLVRLSRLAARLVRV